VDKGYTGYAMIDSNSVNTGFDISALSEDTHKRRLFELRAAKRPGYMTTNPAQEA
jgi:hypothetical protein